MSYVAGENLWEKQRNKNGWTNLSTPGMFRVNWLHALQQFAVQVLVVDIEMMVWLPQVTVILTDLYI